jgi:hypothetical protein
MPVADALNHDPRRRRRRRCCHEPLLMGNGLDTDAASGSASREVPSAISLLTIRAVSSPRATNALDPVVTVLWCWRPTTRRGSR